ncbi:anthocyanidin reductase ((2S)-flavan-3-ol-forming)-like isoform X1 [Miscanthus floridulus]|uniref:anthocyanidin reductase ((2S)-flavan-3-ol-forming)-like isoform X1 n=1 Tax=Miscanthus floridulus TaxID=154761 RepID=UPI0034583479
MSAGDRKKTACVTGGNRYIASALIKVLLENGYAVKTTVRNPERADRAGRPRDSKRAEVVREGGAAVKRVVLTSSAGSVLSGQSCKATAMCWTRSPGPTSSTSPAPSLVSGYTCGHASVQIQVPFHALKDGNALSVSQAYPASKVLLEKAASRFAAEHGISLVTVGTAPARSARPSVLNCLSLLSGDEAAFGALRAMELSGMLALVHVEDLCRAELFVAEEAAAAGRYLCCGLNTTILELARFLTEKYPQYTVKTNLLSGELLEKPRVCLSSAKLVGEGFDYKYKTLDGMYDDMIDYGKTLGFYQNNDGPH